MNEIYGATLTNRYKGGNMKKEATKLCGTHVIAGRVPNFKKPVSLQIFWIEPNRRRDLDNICAGTKFILDGLVVTGRLQNDSRQWVTSITHMFPEPDKKNPHIVVVINEI